MLAGERLLDIETKYGEQNLMPSHETRLEEVINFIKNYNAL